MGIDTKEMMLARLRESLRDYGIRHKTGRELTDGEILQVCDFFCTGFTLLADKFQSISDEVAIIFSTIGSSFNDLGLVVDEKNRKAN